MGYLGNYGGTFGESALTPASNHAEAALVEILLIREIAVLVHGRFEVRLTAACGRDVGSPDFGRCQGRDEALGDSMQTGTRTSGASCASRSAHPWGPYLQRRLVPTDT